MSERLSGVAVVGSANLDLVVGVSRLPRVGETILGRAAGRTLGGKGLNQAIASARTGAPTRFCAVVGEDEAGDLVQRALLDAGVQAAVRRTDAVPTGVAHVFALDGGDNSIVVAAGANARLRPEDAALDVRGAAVVLAQLEVPVEAVAAALAAGRGGGATTVLNAAPAVPGALALLRDVDVLVVNETECEELGGVDALHEAGAATVVRTRGSDGVELHREGADAVHLPAFPVVVIDTTGAGDAFCGALAAALSLGATIEAALVTASAAGAVVAQHRGANTPALSPASLAALVATR